MIPLVGTRWDLELVKAVVERAAESVFTNARKFVNHLVDAIMKLPRAALLASDIAEVVELLSRDISYLTQTTLAIS